MIRELHVSNLALIEDLRVEFGGGFSVFTGETGAGKSILVGAIGLLLGERASSEMVRAGAEEAEVCGTFELGALPPPLRATLDNGAIDAGDAALIVRRRIARNGKNRVFVNQTPVPLSLLKEIGDRLVDFHGQHEHQSLLNPETARSLIDALPAAAPARVAYGEAFAAYDGARRELDDHDRAAEQLAERRDMLDYQYHEIAAMGLGEGEEERLEAELKLLTSAAERLRCVAEIAGLLTDETAAPSLVMAAVKKRLESLAKFDPSARQWIADLENALSVVAELEAFCGSYGDAAAADNAPQRIEQINDRVAKIQRLKKKHQCTLPQLIEKQQRLKADLLALENSAADRAVLARKLDAAMTICRQRGADLSKKRKAAAAEFDRTIGAQMQKLGLVGGEWTTVFHAADAPQPFGLEDAEFLVRTNPGEPFLPLVKTASGGEISRLMLAVKTVMAGIDDVPILIFDEIDTGIGGLVAAEVAQALYGLSRSRQVICISHLHQIASLADHHFGVYKERRDQRTVTLVKRLTDREKVDEIARMLGSESAIGRKHAQELLAGGRRDDRAARR